MGVPADSKKGQASSPFICLLPLFTFIYCPLRILCFNMKVTYRLIAAVRSSTMEFIGRSNIFGGLSHNSHNCLYYVVSTHFCSKNSVIIPLIGMPPILSS